MQMGILMKVSFSKIKKMARVFILTIMETNTLDHGEIIKNMAMGPCKKRMEIVMKVIGKMISPMEKAYTNV